MSEKYLTTKELSNKLLAMIEQYKKLEKEITNYIKDNLDMQDVWWNVQYIEIVNEAMGESQENGEYCDQSHHGEDYYSGDYYYPTKDGRYLKIPYEY